MNTFISLKIVHLLFVIAWFAGLFYFPRLLVNLAETQSDAVAQHLLLMAKRLMRFMTVLMIPALVSGILLAPMFGWQPWLIVKLVLVVLLLGYHHACFILYKKFVNNCNVRSGTFYRWFNEVPTVILIAILILVVAKPL